MKHHTCRISKLLITTLAIVAWFAISPHNVLSQTPTQASIETPTQIPTPTKIPEDIQLLNSVQERALQDVERSREMASVSDLDILFGQEATEIGLPIKTLVETYEATYDQAKPPETWWQPLVPTDGWPAFILLALLAILWNSFSDWIKKFIHKVGEYLYSRLSGTKFLRGLALKRYRQALIEKYQTLRIPFRPDRPLDMAEVYVPLKVAETQNWELIEAVQAISEYQWLTILGAPGSGKTMLLRSLVLTYAQDDWFFRDQHEHTPILLELNRLNGSEDTLEQHLVQTLKRNDFPNGKRFVEAELERGHFTLLLDGLDEVNPDHRTRVVGQIKDLLDQHAECRVVITCRTAVYHGE